MFHFLSSFVSQRPFCDTFRQYDWNGKNHSVYSVFGGVCVPWIYWNIVIFCKALPRKNYFRFEGIFMRQGTWLSQTWFCIILHGKTIYLSGSNGRWKFWNPPPEQNASNINILHLQRSKCSKFSLLGSHIASCKHAVDQSKYKCFGKNYECL